MTRRGFITALAVLFCFAFSSPVVRPAAAQSLADLVQAGKAAGEGGALFGSVELKSGSLKGLPQWTRVLRSVEAERAAFDRCTADATACTTPILRNWRSIITSAAELPRKDRVKAVNDFFNRWPYKLDQELYGMSE